MLHEVQHCIVDQPHCHFLKYFETNNHAGQLTMEYLRRIAETIFVANLPMTRPLI